MFGGPPPAPSPEERALKARQTQRTLNGFVVGAMTLYVAPWILGGVFGRFFKTA